MRKCLILSVLLGAAGTVATVACAQVVKPLDEVFPFSVEHPLEGLFHGGILKDDPEEASFAEIIVEHDEENGYSITVTCISLSLVQDPSQELTFEDGHLGFRGTLAYTGAGFSFDGTLSEDAQQIRGSMTIEAEGEEPNMTEWWLSRVPRVTDLDNHRAYTGKLAAEIQFDMTFCVGQTPGGNWLGTLDIPQQRLLGLPLINFTPGEEGWMTASTPTNPPAILEYRIDETTDRMIGTYSQQFDEESGVELPFEFARDRNFKFKELSRPQTPTPPYPYTERIVAAPHPEGFRLVGTLTIPDAARHGEGPYPTAVLISGSGQQDRDETLFGHKPFHVLADFLTRRGIAVMRYDDRGVGGSRVDDLTLVTQASTADFATDTRAVVEALKQLPEVDRDRIGLIGHSEGGLIAPMVATDGHEDIAFIVLLAAPGVNGGEVLQKQNELLFSTSGASEQSTATVVERLSHVFDLIKADAEDDVLRDAIRSLIESQLIAGGQTPVDSVVDSAMEGTLEQLQSPWFRFFIAHEPAPVLEGLRCPVLALNGGLDLQVWHEQNIPAIEEAIKRGGGDVTSRVFPRFNHLFQPAETGMVNEYESISLTMHQSALQAIADWIIERTAPATGAGENEPDREVER